MFIRVFIGFQWSLFLIQILAQYYIDDEPEEVSIQKQRMEFIRDKIIAQVEDDDFDDADPSLSQRSSIRKDDSSETDGTQFICHFLSLFRNLFNFNS